MIKKLLYTCLLSITLLSCAKDLGNYNYRDLVEPQIAGLEDKISALTHSQLQLSPVLTPDVFSEAQYSFEWKTIAMSIDQTETVIGTTPKLDYTVVLPAGGYYLIYTIRDKSNGVFWRKTSELRVSEATSEGWLVLCADGEQQRTRLDVVSKITGQTYTDVLKNNGMPELKGPRRIMWSKYADPSSPYYLLTDDGTTRLGRNGLAWKEEYMLRYEMGTGSANTADVITDVVGAKIMVGDSKAYNADCVTSIGLFGEINSGLKVAPAVGANINTAMILVPVSLLYDTQNKCFMGYAPTLRSDDVGGYAPLHEMNALVKLLGEIPNGGKVTGTAFGDFPTGLDFVYMENTKYDPNNTNMGVTYTLLSDGSRLSLYGIQLGELWNMVSFSVAYALGKAYYGDLSGCTAIAQAKYFAFSSLKNYMYYAVGSTVYRVDLEAKPLVATQQFTLPGEQISCLKFNLYSQNDNRNRSYDLVVGSVSGDKGTLRVYEGFNSDGDFTSVTPEVHTGLGKIVDVSYREMLQ